MMRKLSLKLFLGFVFLTINNYAQSQPVYDQAMSEKKKGTKAKQLEGMEGSVQTVTILSQKDNRLEFRINLKGYSGKYLKVFALSKTGARKFEIPPDVQKIRSGKTQVKADLNLAGSSETDSDYIELVFTNGMFRFKGMSYVYKLKKRWTPKNPEGTNTEVASANNRTPQIVEVQLIPVGHARRTFIAQ